jgi:nucleotide-binding universal stress UspA family protein
MLEIKKVLITTDFSDAARPAMFRGVDLAKQFGAEIHLLHVVLMAESAPVYPMFSVPADTEKVYRELTEASEQRLRAEAAGLPIGRDQIQLVIEHGNFAAPVILDYARRIGVDLIATGTHGRRGFRHLLLGSVAEEVVRKADCAVMTCRPDVSAQPMSPESILAAVDLSEHSGAVVRHARELAAIYKCRIDFVHVIPEPRFPVYFEIGTSMLWAGDASEVESAARKSLEELVGDTEAPKADWACHVIRGIPDQELVRWAKEKSSDLMVLASHGLTGIGHLLLGSTADKVVRQAQCPVITLHASVGEEGGEGGDDE